MKSQTPVTINFQIIPELQIHLQAIQSPITNNSKNKSSMNQSAINSIELYLYSTKSHYLTDALNQFQQDNNARITANCQKASSYLQTVHLHYSRAMNNQNLIRIV